MALTLTQNDWTRFLDPQGLAEKSGVPQGRFLKMILKELTDNACDAGGATLDVISDDCVAVADTGAGVSLDAFSLKRPLVSSKHWRTGQRGALGNGLRAVMGAIYVLKGHLEVETRSAIHRVSINENGDTETQHLGDSDRQGTRITVHLPDIAKAYQFAATAVELQDRNVISAAKPSPLWFDREAIVDLQRSAEGVSAVDFAAQFGTRFRPGPGLVTDLDADQLLTAMQDQATAMPRVNPIGDCYPGAYAKTKTDIEGLPCVVEVWATAAASTFGGANVVTIMNRTRALQGVSVSIGDKGRLSLSASGSSWTAPKPMRDKLTLRKNIRFSFTVSISAPFVPILSSGKTPNLHDVVVPILELAGKTGRKAQAEIGRKAKGISIADAVNHLLPDAYKRVSSGGRYWANARQLMYAMRPDILRICGIEKFSDSYITQKCIPEFRDANPKLTADWRIAYDKRGALIEPHTGRTVGLGTVEVHGYTATRAALSFDRPARSVGLLSDLDPQDRFGGLLFCEKEGFNELIRQSGVLERNDIALASTKGMSVIAARALIDEMAGRVDGFTVYTLADFDITGQDIGYTLTKDSSRYTFRNTVKVVPLGVNWEQAQALHDAGVSEPVSGDQSSHYERLLDRGLSQAAVQFLAGFEPRRVEINAMASADIVALLREGITSAKVVPPADVLADVWRELSVQHQIAALEEELRQQEPQAVPDSLAERLADYLQEYPELSWDEVMSLIIRRGEVD
ncbi:MAG: ATP-binding protein [Tateyamaria sp.]|uniref:ATP-binding protein n=1 Tax=Tateyamaria sp. TaxID=1929288 RepID=UPI00329C8338